jgi:hypothetical protein
MRPAESTRVAQTKTDEAWATTIIIGMWTMFVVAFVLVLVVLMMH